MSTKKLQILGSLLSEVQSQNVVHGNTKEPLYNIIETYILNIDYDALSFDVTEIVIDSTMPAILGTSIIGSMILGNS